MTPAQAAEYHEEEVAVTQIMAAPHHHALLATAAELHKRGSERSRCLEPKSRPARKQVLKMKHKLEIYNVDSTKEDANSAKRGRKDPAGLPRDDDRLFVTPDPEDPHKRHYFHREDIESTNPAGENSRIDDNILETDPGADEEAPKADD
ncbi:hypothetical protein D6D20_08216 [Aureobasidium pullulans]|uniref:Uncharacterized protein n=1 Tax=Aureobasidium pullulans TaxID=5580 RepID=A0A4S8YT44_AURPU|nr:hypothetical protein D6D20_08216 [Aureobasidium pullulans]